MNLSARSQVVLIHFSLPGNVYIPEHDLFSDTPVSRKHWGCLVYIIQQQKTKKKTEFQHYRHVASNNIGWKNIYSVKMSAINFQGMILHLIVRDIHPMEMKGDQIGKVWRKEENILGTDRK